MKSVVLLFIVLLCCILEAGCGFKSYRPDVLGSFGVEVSRCAVTRVEGVIARDGIILFSRRGMRQYLLQVEKYKLPAPNLLPSGSKVQLMSLSSRWDSGIGWYIDAKAKMNGSVYEFSTGHGTDRSPTMSDFEKFIEDNFYSCRKP